MDSQAFILINLALVFYSVGVWSERWQGVLKSWHFVLFVLGLICDTMGTGIMFEMAGGMTLDVHGVSGVMAIVLMVLHAAWAGWVLKTDNSVWRMKFHRYSMIVWFLWLIPYFSPMFFALA